MACAACAACASSPPPPTQSVDAAFAEIQVQEARLEHARAATLKADAECDAICAAGTDAADAERALCRTARTVGDPDALSRCERGTRDATSIQQAAAQRCTCKGLAP